MVAVAVGTLLVTPSVAPAATMVSITDEALTLSSDTIVTGTVTKIRTRRARDGSIESFVTIAVDETIKGELGSGRVTIRERGGRIGGDEQWLFGNPTYEVGEAVIAFLIGDGHGTLRTNHMALGKFTIERDTDEATAARRLNDTALLLYGAARLQSHDPESRRPADAFRARLRDLVRRQPSPAFRRTIEPPPDVTDDQGEEVAAFRLFNDARWFEPDDGRAVVYPVDSTGDAKIGPAASRAVIDAACKAWTDVPTANLVLDCRGSTSPDGDFCDGKSKLVFNDPNGSVRNPAGCGGVLAVGGYCAGPGTVEVNGVTFTRIVEGDVVFGDGWSGCNLWNATNLAEIATHEIGHTIGLGHSEDPSATMYTYAHFDGRGASLKPDDEAGATFIYPDEDAEVVPPQEPPPPDRDGDDVPDAHDNCPVRQNADQADVDDDGVGNACDNCVAVANPAQRSADACGFLDMRRLKLQIDAERGDRLALAADFRATNAPVQVSEMLADPITITVRNPQGVIVMRESVPLGGWTLNPRGTRAAYRDRHALAGRFTSARLSSRDTFAYRIQATAVEALLAAGREPELSIELDIGRGRHVGITRCETNSRATRVRCRQKED